MCRMSVLLLDWDSHCVWSPDGQRISSDFNSVHEGSRQVYVIDLEYLDEDFQR